MSITNGYTTLPALRASLDLQTDEHNDRLEGIINAASRWIDTQTGRRFYATEETRYYTPDSGTSCRVDDIAVTAGVPQITTVKTDNDGDNVFETTWASVTDYLWKPLNNSPRGATYTPVDELVQNLNTGRYSFSPGIFRSVEIVAKFGYCESTPPDIEETCILIASRMWGRRDALFGVAGTPGLGVSVVTAKIGKDAQIMSVVESYRRVLS